MPDDGRHHQNKLAKMNKSIDRAERRLEREISQEFAKSVKAHEWTEQEEVNYIFESAINGQNKQARELFFNYLAAVRVTHSLGMLLVDSAELYGIQDIEHLIDEKNATFVMNIFHDNNSTEIFNYLKSKFPNL